MRDIGGDFCVGLEHFQRCIGGIILARDLHHDVVGRFAQHRAAHRIDRQRDVGQHGTAISGARDQEFALRVDGGKIAHIGAVRVARNDHVDTRIDLFQNVDQGAGNAAAAFVVIADFGIKPLVDRHHDQVDILLHKLRYDCVDRRRFVGKGQPCDAAGCDEGRRILQRQADDADCQFARAFAKAAHAV